MSIELLVETLRLHGNRENAVKMDAYMKNLFVHLGIKTPERRAHMKAFLKNHPFQKEWIPLLWELPERELQSVAVDMLVLIKKKLTPVDLPMIEYLITTKSWWDSVDGIAAHIAGTIFKAYPEARKEYVEKWTESDNMWLNRTAILHQLHYKQDTDEYLLYDCICRHAHSKEFFHQKAIGWALREYGKCNPKSVIAFVDANELKPLSKREALRIIRLQQEK
ncbi:DNA alkylation repair protein [Paenibacillus sp. GSMTC-2017]|uniref:DNA alkylation repair protein n=1 Tax=Paenibacillus sp. GSMTC-2017 TaxID=2794350 RepID=UPI0018D622DE|nr:DNA alkylation repair protein [Paenibacillus sp. GSMTC-2017]MBH5317637.1 DNA alkylation repair protein [Paenibacillus sp. GSMTC-2017]